MIRKRKTKLDQINSNLDQQLNILQISQNHSFSTPQQTHPPQNHLLYNDQHKFKHQILDSLKKLNIRINNIESKVQKHTNNKTSKKNHLHHRKLSFQDNNTKPHTNLNLTKTFKPTLFELSNRKNSNQAIEIKSKLCSAARTPKSIYSNTGRQREYSSIKLLFELKQEEMSNLKQISNQDRILNEQSRSNKRLVSQKILKIENIIQNQKNMEGIYKNLQWQAKQLVDTLNKTRNLCSYQKQKIDLYKSKLKQLKKKKGKQNH